ncbi:MAG: UrcA family protein, partial [Novosphingobium sp.]
MFKTISAAALGLGLVLAVPAQAQPSSVQVRYGDLDLRHDAGVATLDRRIDAAVRSVCGNPREQTALPMVALVKRCGADARVAVQDQR